MSLRRRAAALRVVLAALALASAGTARAQGSVLDMVGAARAASGLPSVGAAQANVPLSGPVDPSEYIIGPGDGMQVHLGGGVTRTWDIVVSPDGTLFVPSVGPIAVSGHTLLEVRKLVADRIGAEYKGVAFDLSLVRPRIMLVWIAGETRRNGPLEVPATARATEVLVDTLFDRHASTRNIEIRRRTPQGTLRIPLDLQRAWLTGGPGRDPLLRDGDVLYVPVASTHIGIEGAVGRPEFFELAPNDSLSTLLAMGGGPVSGAADEATLVRFRDATHTDTTAFKLSDVAAGRFNPPLQDGDRAFVYFQPGYHRLESASILGEVRRPGAYPLTPEVTRLSTLVSAAGGFLPGANLATLRVYRANLLAGETDPEVERLTQLSRKDMTASEYEVLRARTTARREDFRVDWNRVHGNPDLDMTLRDGDIVRVDPVLPSVRVEGEVRRPGLVRFEAGRRVDAYVRLAGGFSDRAARGQVRITRAVTGQTILARDADGLEPGDLVWVPERGETQTWQNLQSLLLVLAQIATVIVAVRR